MRRGTVAELHGIDPFVDGSPAGPYVQRCDLTDAALVLGSRQSPETADAAACRDTGVSVVRRRSGGGAVLLRPDAVVWADLVVPHGVAPDDVRGSMVWAGHRWAEALAAAVGSTTGPAARPLDLHVHEGGMVCTPWSGLVCFAGVGPGEVLLGGRKLVGLSQRRTRHGLRIQGTLYTRSVTDELVGLLAGPLPAGRPADPAVLTAVEASVVGAALAEALAGAPVVPPPSA